MIKVGVGSMGNGNAVLATKTSSGNPAAGRFDAPSALTTAVEKDVLLLDYSKAFCSNGQHFLFFPL